MTLIWSLEIWTSRWTASWTSRWTTGGTSGSTSMSLKLSEYESSMAKGGYSLSSRRTKNSQLTTQKTKSVEIHLSLTLMRVKLVLFKY